MFSRTFRSNRKYESKHTQSNRYSPWRVCLGALDLAGAAVGDPGVLVEGETPSVPWWSRWLSAEEHWAQALSEGAGPGSLAQPGSVASPPLCLHADSTRQGLCSFLSACPRLPGELSWFQGLGHGPVSFSPSDVSGSANEPLESPRLLLTCPVFRTGQWPPAHRACGPGDSLFHPWHLTSVRRGRSERNGLNVTWLLWSIGFYKMHVLLWESWTVSIWNCIYWGKRSWLFIYQFELLAVLCNFVGLWHLMMSGIVQLYIVFPFDFSKGCICSYLKSWGVLPVEGFALGGGADNHGTVLSCSALKALQSHVRSSLGFTITAGRLHGPSVIPSAYFRASEALFLVFIVIVRQIILSHLKSC